MIPPRAAPDRLVRILQWAVGGLFVLWVGALLTWLLHLGRLAWRFQNAPPVSIGIPLVVIPILFTLLGVVLYVVWGLLTDRSEQ